MPTANTSRSTPWPISAAPALQPAGAIADLTVLDAADLPRYKCAVTAGAQIGWGYYFPGLFTLVRPDRSAILLTEDEGSMCVFRWRQGETGQRLDLLLAPTPMNVAVLARCLERANDFNGDRSARVLRVDEKDAAAVASVPGLGVRPRKPQFLFAPSTYTDLGGSRFRTIRRNVARIEALPDVRVLPFGERQIGPCQALLRGWGERHQAAHGTSGGLGTSRRAIDLVRSFAAPDLAGEVVLLGERLVAYALWGEIRPGVAAFFDAKCETEPAGLSIFHRYRFLSGQRQFALINDGSDVGREGLRQLKNSLRPVGMHVEHRAMQVQ